MSKNENETDGSKNENNPTNIVINVMTSVNTAMRMLIKRMRRNIEERKHIINIKNMNGMIDNSNITITAMNE